MQPPKRRNRGVTEEQIKQARDVDILTFLRSTDPQELISVGRGEYKTRTHDSLRISENGKWNWCSRGFGGTNALNYLIRVQGMDFVSAVRLLNEMSTTPVFYSEQVKSATPKKVEKPFELPVADKDNSFVEAYLKGRAINSKVIRQCINNGSLYQTTRGGFRNCVFVGKDENGTAKSGSVRGCQGSFRGSVTGSDKQYGFLIPAQNPECDIVEVYEAPIDAMSGASLRIENKADNWRAVNYLAMCGLNYNTLPDFPAEFIPYLLKEENNSRNTNAEIIRFFAENPALIDRIRFIREGYQTVFHEMLLEGDKRVGFYKTAEGLLVWEGGYPNRESQSVLSWHRVVRELATLIQNGELVAKINVKSIPAPALEPAQLSFDTSAEVAEEVPPDIAPEVAEALGLRSSEQQDTDIQKASAKAGIKPEPQRGPDPSIVTEEEIKAVLIRGSGFSEGKNRIYRFYAGHPTQDAFADMLKKEYGNYLLREDLIKFDRYQKSCNFIWEHHIETIEDVRKLKADTLTQMEQLKKQRRVYQRKSYDPDHSDEKAENSSNATAITQELAQLRQVILSCETIEQDYEAIHLKEQKVRQIQTEENRKEREQHEQRRRSR